MNRAAPGHELRFALVVSLWLAGDDVDAFEAFERDAARVIARHGGRIEQVIRAVDNEDGEAPFETHVVTFPGRCAFDAYRDDPATRALAKRREQVIARTVIHVGRVAPNY